MVLSIFDSKIKAYETIAEPCLAREQSGAVRWVLRYSSAIPPLFEHGSISIADEEQERRIWKGTLEPPFCGLTLQFTSVNVSCRTGAKKGSKKRSKERGKFHG